MTEATSTAGHGLPVVGCGARVCGMHPAHRHTLDDGTPALCPGND